MTSYAVRDLDQQCEPPSQLFKYLSVARIENVLEQRAVRFTTLMNTNDSFEVRSTFRKFAGPRFAALLAQEMDRAVEEAKIDEMIVQQLQKRGLGWISKEMALKAIEAEYGNDFRSVLRVRMQKDVDSQLMPHINNPKFSEEMVEKFGKELFCFSLSERAESAPMWAHYADNHCGFVVAFNTDHEWFRIRKDGKKSRLQRVTYFDGMVEEPLENISAALISKTSDWAYEREWRLYVGENQVDATFGDPNDPIYVLHFPVELLERVIVGSKASAQTVEKIRSILARLYPNARLTRAEPNRRTHTFDEVEI